MMRVAYCMQEGSTLAWAKRLKDEGADVMLYMAPQHKGGATRRQPSWRVGEGIVPKARSRDEWVAFGAAYPNTIWFFDTTDSGELAERLRMTGKLVVGGGEFCDRLENDREFGFKIAQECGVSIPPYKAFASVSAAIAFLKTSPQQEVGDGGWAWKSNRNLDAGTFVGSPPEVIEFLEGSVLPSEGDSIACILQERIAGVALSTARWFNGRSFVGPFEGTIEEKKFMNDDVGPSTGCSLNLVWFYQEAAPRVARMLHWDVIEAAFRKHNAPAGLYDINAVVTRSDVWFLEWTPRLGIDSELTSQRGIDSLSDLLLGLAYGKDVDTLFDTNRVYAGFRLSVPPYPTAAEYDLPNKRNALGVPVNGADGLWRKNFVGVGLQVLNERLVCADPDGFIGCVVGAGTNVSEIDNRLRDYVAHDLRVPKLQYRTDAAKIIERDLEAMEKAGYSATRILQRGEVAA